MSLDAMLKTAGDCFSPGFKFPAIGEPGLPTFIVALFMTTMGGINLVLEYLPVPSPKKIPKLKVPDVNFFLDIFITTFALPNIPGLDLSGAMNFILTCVHTVFSLFKELILTILKLSPKVLTLDVVITLFKKFALQFQLPKDMKMECVPKAVMGLVKTLLPI